MGTMYNVLKLIRVDMNIIAKGTLRDFWERHAETEQPLKSWYHIASKASWTRPHDIKQIFASASIIADNRVVFDICGNNYRLVVKFNYPYQMGFVRFIGTHKEYDKIDATGV